MPTAPGKNVPPNNPKPPTGSSGSSASGSSSSYLQGEWWKVPPKDGLKGTNPAFLKTDAEKGILVGGKYIKNPTAKPIQELITPNGIIGTKKSMYYSGEYMYVIDSEGSIIIGSRAKQFNPQGLSHPTLIGGENPQVRGAGIVSIQGGKLKWIDDASGHFQHSGTLDAAREAFGRLPKDVFSPEFEGYLSWQRNR
jgi:hypothetical protein